MQRGRKSKAATASQNDNTVASRLRSRTVPTNGEDESTLTADINQQDKTVSRDPQPESIERDSTRKQIQMTCSCIDKLIKERGSRRACLGLLNKLDDMLATVERLNLLVVDPSDADEFSKQAQIQIELFTLIESKKEDVENYVTLRADDESSVGSCIHSVKSVPPATRPPAADRNEETQSEKSLAEARKRVADAQQEAAQLRERLEEVNKKADLANKEESKLSDAAIRRGSAPTITSSPFHGWGDGAIEDWRHRSTHEPTKEDGEEEAPDDWIYRYCNGLEEANWSYFSKAAARGELPIYSGRATDWFWWSDLLRSMVHD
jgi:DNA mismatch repair ATPase MutS